MEKTNTSSVFDCQTRFIRIFNKAIRFIDEVVNLKMCWENRKVIYFRAAYTANFIILNLRLQQTQERQETKLKSYRKTIISLCHVAIAARVSNITNVRQLQGFHGIDGGNQVNGPVKRCWWLKVIRRLVAIWLWRFAMSLAEQFLELLQLLQDLLWISWIDSLASIKASDRLVFWWRGKNAKRQAD